MTINCDVDRLGRNLMFNGSDWIQKIIGIKYLIMQ